MALITSAFKPKKNYNLIRLGASNDGGYLTEKSSVDKAKLLIALGIGGDWSFERAFSNNFKNKRVICVDRDPNIWFLLKWFLRYFRRVFIPVPRSGWLRKRKYKRSVRRFVAYSRALWGYARFRHHLRRAYIGPDRAKRIDKDGGEIISLQDILTELGKGDPFFIKCDVEGAEYEILDDILKHQKLLTGLVIEFHHIHDHMDEIIQFIAKFDLELVHIHPCNCATANANGDPQVIEVSFARSPKPLNNKEVVLPHKLDQKSSIAKEDITLSFQ